MINCVQFLLNRYKTSPKFNCVRDKIKGLKINKSDVKFVDNIE